MEFNFLCVILSRNDESFGENSLVAARPAIATLRDRLLISRHCDLLYTFVQWDGIRGTRESWKKFAFRVSLRRRTCVRSNSRCIIVSQFLTFFFLSFFLFHQSRDHNNETTNAAITVDKIFFHVRGELRKGCVSGVYGVGYKQ